MSGIKSRSEGTLSSTLITWLSWLVVPCAAYSLRPRLSSAYLGIVAAAFGILGRMKIVGPEAQVQDMTGKKVLITGGNVGLGFETAKTLASWGADVTIACRNMKKADDCVKKIRKRLTELSDSSHRGSISAMELDLADLESIKHFSLKYIEENKDEPLDVLINNAGILMDSLERTKCGFEMNMGTNHLGHFALTQELLPLLERSSDGRIVTVSSMAHKMVKPREILDNFNYNAKPEEFGAWVAYSKSKLANILFTRELQKRLDKKGIHIMAMTLHPGVVRTSLFRYLTSGFSLKSILTIGLVLPLYPITKSPHQGAQTQIHCSSDPCLRRDKAGGQYFVNCNVYPNSIDFREHDAIANELWELSERLTKRKFL